MESIDNSQEIEDKWMDLFNNIKPLNIPLIEINKEKFYQKHYPRYYPNQKKQWRQDNRDKYLISKKRSSIKDRNRHPQHYRIRGMTYRKYGSLPKGWEYHHFTEPYHVDLWIGVHKSEHKKIFK